MTEQQRDIGQFESAPVSEALTAFSWTTHDVAHGPGQAFSVADGKTVLEVYPDAAVARVTTQDTRVELFRVPGYSVDADRTRVVFEQGQDPDRSRLILRGDGKLSLHPVLRGTEASSTDTSSETRREIVQAISDSLQTITPPPDRPPEPDEKDAVTLQGRLGRDPSFRTGERPTGFFPLAVNAEEKTTWHNVVVFDETAETLREQHRAGDVRKGRLVDVTGRQVMPEEGDARGKKPEFHATSVTRVRATRRQ